MQTKSKFVWLFAALYLAMSYSTQAAGEPPMVLSLDPPPSAVVRSLTFVNVIFTKSVAGVDAGDLLINSVAAINVSQNNPRDYTFSFTQPVAGTLSVEWAATPGISDTENVPNAFDPGPGWTYTLDPTALPATALISEFMADNNSGIKDEDAARSDWIEIYNPGPVNLNLDGWFLTDDATNLTKWRFPSVPLAANKYLLVWASAKNRLNAAVALHTNFKLSKESGYLALVDPGTNVVSVFNPYPSQVGDVSYVRDRVDPNLVGYSTQPTPGEQNSSAGPGFLREPVFSLASGVYTDSSLSLTLSNPDGIGTIRYTTDQSLPTASSTAYTGPITLSANATIKARIFPPNATSLLPSAVVARNFIFLDSTAANFTSKVPMLLISTEGRAIRQDVAPGGARTKGSLTVIDTVRGQSSIQSQSDFQELAEFEFFGQTSLGFPKKPIRVEIQDSIGNDLDKKMLGMPADSDWRLRNPYNDKTLLNDFLGYGVWEKMGHYSVRRRMVEVFVDTGGGRVSYPGDYYGVMMLCETIKVNKDRVDIAKLSPFATNGPAVTGGYIFKRDKDSAGDLNFSSPGGLGFAAIPLHLHEPKPNELRYAQGVTTTFPGAGYTPAGTNQMNYLRNFLGAMERALYTNTWLTQTGTNHYTNYLDPERFADQMLHVEFTKQIDGYRLSDYFSKDRMGRVGPGPVWDWNLAYGNANYLNGGQTNGWYYEAAGQTDHPWARRLITGTTAGNTSSGDPNFVQLVADRWAMFRTNVLNGTNVNREIDELSATLSEAAARDLFGKYRSSLIGKYTWPNPDGGVVTAGSTGSADGRDVDFVRPTNYLGAIETEAPATADSSIIGQMKKWVLGRYLWMDSQFTGVPTFSSPGGVVPSGSTVVLYPPPGATLYYTLDGTDPRASGGSVIPGALSNNGSVTINVTSNILIVARAKAAGAWKGTFSGMRSLPVHTTIPRLVITEIMYHPLPAAAGSPYIDEDFEYIELKNVGPGSLNLNAYALSGGIDFIFPNQVVAAGARVLVVKNLAAFNSRYPGLSAMVAGEYTGNLANDGNRLVLEGGVREPILDFKYDDDWHPVTDGFGFSLVIVDENAAVNTWGFASSWRASGQLNGTPGHGDSATSFPQVVINEALSHSDPQPPTDTIELRNLSNAAANIGDWYLTDDFRNPKKYRIAAGTTIPANGYITFNEGQFNTPSNAPTSFALSSSGDEVYLFSGDADGNLTGYVHGFKFGPAPSLVTFGRHVLSTGEEHFVLEASATLGAANAGPRIGPVVISEIMYHPPDVLLNGAFWDNTEDEYIELYNISGANAPLFDPLNLNNTWRLRDAVDFTFPAEVTIPQGGYALVVSFDPNNAAALAAFRNANGVPAGTPIYGPWNGKLDNSSESVELVRPGPPGAAGTPTAGHVTYYIADKVKYEDKDPWPVGLPDGLGASLGRVNNSSYGNDPGNWRTSPKTPGAPLPVGDVPPAIVSQPSNTTGVEGQSASFTLSATGSALGYIWTFNGKAISGASSPTLTLNNLALNQAGTYACFVFNSAGSVQSSNATLIVNMIPRITQHPAGREVYIKPDSKAANLPNGTNVTFTVAASSSVPPITYQWRFNGVNIPGAVGASYTVVNVQLENEGDYSCAVTDGVGTAVSQPARLVPWLQPVIIFPPVNQTVTAGGLVTMSVAVTGNPLPMEFSWRRNVGSIEIAVTNGNFRTNMITLNTDDAFLNLVDGMASTNHGMRIVIKNDAHTAPGINTVFNITVVADTDRDGIADTMELALGLDPNNAADAAGDLDNDGMSNRAETIAGTDATNSLSYLKIEQSVTPGVATLQFGSISNRTYSVQFSDGLGITAWRNLGSFPARRTNYVHQIADPSWTTNRFYRVVTPWQP